MATKKPGELPVNPNPLSATDLLVGSQDGLFANKILLGDVLDMAEAATAEQRAAAEAAAASALSSKNSATARAAEALASKNAAGVSATNSQNASLLSADYRDQSQGYSEDSYDSSVLSDQARVGAVSAKTGAETARDQALAASRIYPTTAAGVAAVVDGDYFAVPSATSTEYVRLYRRNGSAATDTGKVYPSSALVQQLAAILLQTSPFGYAFTVLDALGKASAGIADDGTVEAWSAIVKNLTAEVLTGLQSITIQDWTIAEGAASNGKNYGVSVLDPARNLGFGLTLDGKLDVPSLLVGTINGVPAEDFAAGVPTVAELEQSSFSNILHVISYGQSNSIGFSATPPISTSQVYSSLKFNGGVRTQDTVLNPRTSLVPLTETTANSNGETACSGLADMFNALVLSEDGIAHTDHDYRVLCSAPGESSKSALELSKGGQFYQRMIDDIAAGAALSNASFKTYKPQLLLWTQGETEQLNQVSGETWISQTLTIRDNAQSDTLALHKMTSILPLVTCQISSHGNYASTAGRPISSEVPSIAYAALSLGTSSLYPRAFLACPTYMLDFNPSDNAHYTVASQRILGSYYGLVFKRVVRDQKPWLPLYPKKGLTQGRVINLIFNVPKGRLVFDTTRVTAQTNMGFEVYDNTGSEIAISSVTISDIDTVTIVCASTVGSGAYVRYASKATSATSGRTAGARGNLRDTQGDTIVVDPSTLNYRLDNWCCMFQFDL